MTTLPNTPEQIVDYKQYKWIVSSCLQKSLRRGRFDLAEGCVRFLWEHDRNYLTYRFGTILTEDVGIANIPLIKEYLDTKLGKKAIDEKGGLDFFLDITQRACESVKDRSSCDSAYISGYFGLEANTENLTALFKDNSAYYIERINAGWLILGNQKFKNDNLNFPDITAKKENNDIKNESMDQYLELVTEMTDSTFSDTVLKAYNTQIENISLGMVVMQAAFDYEKSIQPENAKLKVGATIENTYIKETSFFHKGTGLNLISCGVDGHTREGKGVYYQFLKTKNPVSDYLNSKGIPSQDHMLLFSHCMFRVEGHEVNKRIYFPTAVKVMRDCESTILNMKAGREPNDLDFSVLRTAILDSMPIINSLRAKQLENAPIPMIDKPEPKVTKTKKIKIT
jgi:hypothetical protein